MPEYLCKLCGVRIDDILTAYWCEVCPLPCCERCFDARLFDWDYCDHVWTGLATTFPYCAKCHIFK